MPEEHGGLGGSNADLALLMEQFGRGLVTSPFVPTIVLGGTILRLAGSDAQKAAILPGIAEGSGKLALAYLEPPAQANPAIVATRAVREGSGYVISGEKVAVLYGNVADQSAGQRADIGRDRRSAWDLAVPGAGECARTDDQRLSHP